MGQTVIKNATIVLPNSLEKNQMVIVEDGQFVNIVPQDGTLDVNDKHIIDAENNYIAPGFIDLHIHGTGNYLIDKGPTDLEGLCSRLPQYGVIGFLPTVCPLPAGKDAEFLGKLAKVESRGSAILGFHLEGPFLSITGALPSDALGKADPERVNALIQAAGQHKTIFSISPELRDIENLIPLMARDGNAVFMTHTKATVEQTCKAIKAGASHATHFYDVFYAPQTDHGVRPCGAVEAILADSSVSVDFILDGEHVDPVAVKMAINCKGFDKVCLITDANIGAGMPPGRYDFVSGEVEFKYPGGPAMLTENSAYPGGIAGSGLTMDLTVRNAIQMLDIDLPQAVRMASANPARVLGLENRKGIIKKGFDADFVILDRELRVVQTWIDGNCVFKAE